MRQLRLQQPMNVLQGLFAQVNYADFQDGFQKYWRTVSVNGQEYATPQSFCWLYCWANNGEGEQQIGMMGASRIFQAAFGSYTFSNDDLNTFAHDHRYESDVEFSYRNICELDTLL